MGREVVRFAGGEWKKSIERWRCGREENAEENRSYILVGNNHLTGLEVPISVEGKQHLARAQTLGMDRCPITEE